MHYDEEEFYGSLVEFDGQILELKNSLERAVKNDFLHEMEQIKAENAELQQIKRDWASIQREYANKMRELEQERKRLESQVRHERLSSLMRDFKLTMYCVTKKDILPPKCNKCNNYRRVQYTTPLGRRAEEACECSESIHVYEPSESELYAFDLDRNRGKVDMLYRVRSTDSNRDGERFERVLREAEAVYEKGMEFEFLDSTKTFFHTREECQEYCDWLSNSSQK